MFLWLILIVLMPIPKRRRHLRLLHLLRLENQGMVQMGGVLGLSVLPAKMVNASIAYKLTRGFM